MINYHIISFNDYNNFSPFVIFSQLKLHDFFTQWKAENLLFFRKQNCVQTIISHLDRRS